MKTDDLIKAAGSVRAIADALGITHQAVYAWGAVVPESRIFEITVKKPEWLHAASKPTAKKGRK